MSGKLSRFVSSLNQPNLIQEEPPEPAILTVANNANHPKLNAQSASDFLESAAALHQAHELAKSAYNALKDHPIQLTELKAACIMLGGVAFIVDETIDEPVNHRFVAYAESERKQ